MANLDPLYKKSFVGIWKRILFRGRPDPELNFLIFNANDSFVGPIGPGGSRQSGTVEDLDPDPPYPEKGLLKVKARGQVIEWSYTLNRNNAFKAEFHPLPGSNRTPPVLNELFLVGQGQRQLYAFFSHPFKRIMIENDIIKHI